MHQPPEGVLLQSRTFSHPWNFANATFNRNGFQNLQISGILKVQVSVSMQWIHEFTVICHVGWHAVETARSTDRLTELALTERIDQVKVPGLSAQRDTNSGVSRTLFILNFGLTEKCANTTGGES